jgi:hypothetical protein
MNILEYSPKQAFNALFSFGFLEKEPEPPKRTTADRLQDMVKSIALEITNGLEDYPLDAFERWHEEGEPDDFTPNGDDLLDTYLYEALDFKYIVGSDGTYYGTEIMVAFGGPNIYVDTRDNTVYGYWGVDREQWGFVDNIGLDGACEDFFQALEIIR